MKASLTFTFTKVYYVKVNINSIKYIYYIKTTIGLLAVPAIQYNELEFELELKWLHMLAFLTFKVSLEIYKLYTKL